MQKNQQLLWLCWLSLVVFALPANLWAQGTCNPVAQIVSVQGEIRLNGDVLDNAAAMRTYTNICVGDLISAGQLSRATIAILNTDAVIRIDQNTELRLNVEEIADPSFLEVLKGAINILSPAPVDLGVKTAFVNAAVEGTEFHVRVERDQATVTVLEGRVSVTDSDGRNELAVIENQAASAKRGQAPTLDASVDATNIGTAVQWAHFYPPVLDYKKPMPALTASDPLFHTRQAAQYLDAGAVDSARQAIEAAKRLDNDNEEAWALSLIIELAQYDRTPKRTRLIREFLDAAQERTFAAPAALIALSYAQQWNFNLQGALNSLQTAAEIDKDNVLVMARLSEVWLSLGDLDKAEKKARRAKDISADARADTVLGFAYLAQIKITEAEAAFTDAIGESPSDPLPRLGLGLAKIRRGDLGGGRLEILAASGEDQGSAILRSYLGKTYYEEKLGPLDKEQYEIAKALDPNDPTAWFYDAIRLQTTNQPVEALHNLKKSIALNDNRAVYRSRLLLDQDLAARSASLARIYRDLGFENIALLEGWKSVNQEPGNHSGHRFLADVYSTLPRHQIARTNELFRSQILQPINVSPIKPQLAEPNLFVLDKAGPSELSFNEFNPIFDRDRMALEVSGVIGGNDTKGDDVVLYGISDRWSYSFGQYHFETDGFRENNDLDQDVFNGFVQFRPTYKTSIQGEVRSTDTETGDLSLRFDPDNFISSQREEEEVDSLRLSLRHSFSIRSEFLASGVFQDAEGTLNLPPTLSAETELDGYQLQAQHIYTGDRFSTVGGLSYVENDIDETLNITTMLPVPPFVVEISQASSTTVEHSSAYIYANLRHFRNLTITVGGSADFLNGRTVDEDLFNPKIGLIWEPRDGTTFRAAAFRTIQRPFISKQNIQPSLEPTQVAGFNQFFFGVEGEEVWRYGVGLDQSLSKDFFVGAEYSERDRDVPITVVMPVPLVSIIDADEKLGRAYAYWTPKSSFTVGTEYQYEEIDNGGESFDQGATELETHRISLRFNYFSKNGLSAGFDATYVDQEGIFLDVNSGIEPAGADEFWSLDASLRYRLKNRRGIVSLTLINALDEEFRFQDTDPENPTIIPERWVLLKFTAAFGD